MVIEVAKHMLLKEMHEDTKLIPFNPGTRIYNSRKFGFFVEFQAKSRHKKTSKRELDYIKLFGFYLFLIFILSYNRVTLTSFCLVIEYFPS